MSHVVLERQFSAVILAPDGCRTVHKDVEDEAEWSAGELLITFTAAKSLARRGASNIKVANRYGISPRRAGMRMNASGARTTATRQQRRRA